MICEDYVAKGDDRHADSEAFVLGTVLQSSPRVERTSRYVLDRRPLAIVGEASDAEESASARKGGQAGGTEVFWKEWVCLSMIDRRARWMS